MKEELLFGLTPAEGWVWNYLEYLAFKQGSTHVILPRPGEDPRAEKIFSRKHLKRILKALKAKRHLTLLIIPRSKSKQIEVFVPASKIGDPDVLNNEKGCNGVPNNCASGTPRSSITTLGTSMSPINEVIQATLPDVPPHKLKLKEKLEKLLKLKQGDLRREIETMGPKELFDLSGMMSGICRVRPKGRKISERAKLFAMIRYQQEGWSIQKPQAWVDTVAREAERKWNEVSSGGGGRSRSPGESGVGLTSAWGKF